MSRSKHKQVSVPESVLIVLLSGKPVTLDEITTTLAGKIVPGRIATYMWVLKLHGAVITRTKVGNKIASYTLTNPEAMVAYLFARKTAGANIPDLPQFSAATPTSDLAAVIEVAEDLVTA